MSKQVDDLETLVAALPDVMYISDASEEVQCECRDYKCWCNHYESGYTETDTSCE